ncbi:MAG: TolC family protein [Bacteroidales bacterium]
MQKRKFIEKLIVSIVCSLNITVYGQTPDSLWTLPKCIDQAMQKNISIQEMSLSNETNQIQELQARAERFPSLNASVSQNFQWSRPVDLENNYGEYEARNGTTFGINSSVVLYNGFRIKNSIKQAELSYKAGSYEVDALKESVSLQVLSAYLQVLYSEEQVKNTEKQIESTSQQLSLSEERLRLGSIAKSDYLQVKSELATENYTLASAQNQLAVNQVTLMQLMEIPVTPGFKIQRPDFDISKGYQYPVSSDSIYLLALGIKPQVKSSELNKQIAEIEISIAKAGYQPSLSLSAGINSSYQSGGANAYSNQLMNQMIPAVGINLSIPIYQNRQLKSSVARAKIGISDAGLQDLNTKNQLRKNIEQAAVDFNSAIIKYQASLDKFNSSTESYDVAQEKFKQGLLNSVDFLIQKTNLISAESELLQSKYNLVFSKKIIDFYAGIPLTF